MFASFRCNDCVHVGPVISVRPAIVALCLERAIRNVPGQVVVVACVVIVRVNSGSHGTDECQVMGLLCKQWRNLSHPQRSSQSKTNRH